MEEGREMNDEWVTGCSVQHAPSWESPWRPTYFRHSINGYVGGCVGHGGRGK